MIRLGPQILRYAVVGGLTNGGLYLAYLALIWLGLPYRWAMSAAYVAGTAAAFVGHRRWTFAHSGPAARSALRFVAAYASGYVLNLAGLSLLVEAGGMGAALAQAAMVDRKSVV